MNVFKSILNDETACLLLYGEVSDEGGDGKISSREFVSELSYCDNNYAHIEIHINSVGGEVYPGIAIFNAIRSCKSEVTLYVDGIAASIAGVITLCGRKVKMSQYARMMLHSVSCGCFGNKNDLKDAIQTIEGLEDTIAKIVSKRCGITPEEVKSTYFDGKDHWITADEALAAGLVDEIYDVDEDVPAASTYTDIYKIFINRLERMRSQSQYDKDMKLEDLKKIPRFANCADEQAALAEVNEVAARADKADELEAENKALRERVAQVENERIEETVDNAVADGRINANQKDTYRNLLKADYKNGVDAIKALRPKRILKDELNGGEPGDGASSWEKRQREIQNRYMNRKG
jgi:ATP-dependent Clp endopeptidase proteolytic subunit ClpP